MKFPKTNENMLPPAPSLQEILLARAEDENTDPVVLTRPAVDEVKRLQATGPLEIGTFSTGRVTIFKGSAGVELTRIEAQSLFEHLSGFLRVGR